MRPRKIHWRPTLSVVRLKPINSMESDNLCLPTGKGPTLRRELGPRHLTLFAISSVIGTRPLAEAAHAGPSSVVLWILAVAGVLMPLGIACVALTVRYPGCGGLYVWTRNNFEPWHGFLCFWVYWVGIAFWFPAATMMYASVAIYGLSARCAHLVDDRSCVLIASVVTIWVALGTNLVGLKIGKWTENLGSDLCMAPLARVGSGSIGCLEAQWQRYSHSDSPEVGLGNASFWPNIAFEVTGIELLGMMGDEIVDPKRNVPRATLASCAFGCVFYIVMTLALLVLSRPEKISELYGLAEGGSVAARLLSAPLLRPLVAVL